MTDKFAEEKADKLAGEVFEINKAKGLRIRKLLDRFGYKKRTEDNVTRITELLLKRNVLINPSIMKLGDTWKLKFDDKVYLIPGTEKIREKIESKEDLNIYDWKKDPWFETVSKKVLRTEREVESKFIMPLLSRLGYSEDDRYDGMPVDAASGQKQKKLIVDFALFDTGNDLLEGQVLLVVEAKREDRLTKQVEIENAQRQVKSYAVWLSCYFGLVTDSKIIQIIDLFPKRNGMKVIFECNREELKEQFIYIYNLISKEKLTDYYEQLNK